MPTTQLLNADTVVTPLQAARLTQAAPTPGHALSTRHREKMSKHGEACRSAGMEFIPMPVETMGGWAGKEAGVCSSQADWTGRQ